jgi:UDP-2,3-diacylglucosamine pyrophosphatase LpxH
MILTRHNPASVTLEIPAKSTEELTVMLASDIHYDSCACDIKLFEKHLRIAEEKQAPVIIAGDLFDAMQGRDDPRRSIEELKSEYAVSSYFDAIVLDVSRFLLKFKVPYYIIGLGNHETSVLRKINTDLVQRLCLLLRLEGQPAEAMGYWGYVRFMFKYKKGGGSAVKNLYYHHGKSNGAPVTKGIIQVNRQGVYLHDADIVLNGHNHQSYCMPVQVEKLNQMTMRPYTQTVWYLRTPGYKMSPGDSLQTWGYGPEKHRSPTPRGCMFVNMTYTHSSENVEADIVQKIS